MKYYFNLRFGFCLQTFPGLFNCYSLLFLFQESEAAISFTRFTQKASFVRG